MPASKKQTTLENCGYPQVGCYTLHGSLTSPYKAGFLTSGSVLLLPFSYKRTMGYWKVTPLLQWPDRSGFTPDSLFRSMHSCTLHGNIKLHKHILLLLLNFVNTRMITDGFCTKRITEGLWAHRSENHIKTAGSYRADGFHTDDHSVIYLLLQLPLRHALPVQKW